MKEHSQIQVVKDSWNQQEGPVDSGSKREKWNSLEYYLLNLGASVGFGCVWRFCYLLYDGGGGAFLIPFLLINIGLIYPCMVLLISTGQVNKKGMASSYSEINKKFTGLAYTKCAYSIVVSSYYAYLLAYNLIFMFKSIFEPLPWLEYQPKEMIESLTKFFHEEIIFSNQRGKGILMNQLYFV